MVSTKAAEAVDTKAGSAAESACAKSMVGRQVEDPFFVPELGGDCNPCRPMTFSMVASATHDPSVFKLENPGGLSA